MIKSESKSALVSSLCGTVEVECGAYLSTQHVRLSGVPQLDALFLSETWFSDETPTAIVNLFIIRIIQ